MMGEELKKYGLKLYWAERDANDPDSEPIDFDISDGEDNVAWVWGSEPFSDVQCECNHPYQCIEFGDKEEQGECILCGAYCDWHYEKDDEGHDVPEPHDWYPTKKVGGLIGKYLKHLQDRW